MSGIFDLFGGTGNSAMSQSSLGPTEAVKKSAIGSTMFGGAMAAKSVGASRPKPKGLSIRSGNAVNISNLNVKSSKSPRAKSPIKGLVKPNGEQLGSLLPLSPRNKSKTSKMQIMKSKQLKALSAKTASPENNLARENKQAEEYAFKKPSTPKKSTRKPKVYREPETLASFYDPEKELDDYDLDKEFVKLMKLSSNNVKPYEDEGFDSDPEMTRPPIPPVIELHVLPLDDEDLGVEPPELPALSDDDDFWNDD